MKLFAQLKRRWALGMAFRRFEKNTILPDMEYIISDAEMILRYVESGETPDMEFVKSVAGSITMGTIYLPGEDDDGGVFVPKE